MPAWLQNALLLVLVAAGIVAAAFTVSELRRYRTAAIAWAERSAELVDERDAARRGRRAAEDDVRLARDLLDAELARAMAEHGRLRDEVASALEQRDAMSRELAARQDELAAARQSALDARRDELRPLPEAVRVALKTIEECLRADGYAHPRLLRAASLGDHALTDVEWIRFDPAEKQTDVFVAERVELLLDRAAGTIVFRHFGGSARHGGEIVEFPVEGYPVTFGDVWGPMWEERLGYLIEATGEYGEEVTGRPSVTVRQRWVEEQWRSRVSRLLDRAKTDLRWRLDRARRFGDGVFEDALLLGYGPGKTLESSIEAGRFWVEINTRAGLVSLRVEDGILHGRAGDTTIPASGHRILLSGVSAKEAEELMLGMVVSDR